MGGKGGNARVWWITGRLARGFSSKLRAVASGHRTRDWSIVEVPDIQFEVFMSIIQIRCAGYSEIKSKHLTKICMWAKKKIFLNPFFFFRGHISGGVFFFGGGIIYFAALDLGHPPLICGPIPSLSLSLSSPPSSSFHKKKR
jgi:hypothetical protein